MRVSRRRWYEYVFSTFNYLPFRCMACHSRFFQRMDESR
ncbi:hypothetical protein GRAN_2340 [Granulicella sibirica]|uniref:Uncharacterized protein n=1 Tax=Granulicella sibirica TaxID=2479048 RepID=A0A4Q0SWM0_9BACT|nr:hypothetical protein GRAN_2340 [Granulicella sibirica]